MARLTLNGLNEKVRGIEKLIETIVKNILQEIKETKDSIADLKTNELQHMRADIEALKKFYWKATGSVVTVIVIIEILARWVIK